MTTMRYGSVLALLLIAGPAAATTRIASLVPFVSEALVRVADPELQLVATSRLDRGWTPPAGVADLGNAHAPDFERLAAAQADLLVADRRWHARLGDRVASLGLKVFWIEAEGVEATLTELERLGTTLGAPERIESSTTTVRAALQKSHVATNRRVVVVFGAPGSFLIATESTWLGDLLRTLGVTLVAPPAGAAGGYPGYAPVSEEFLATAAIDDVLLVAHGDPQAVREAFERDWTRIRGARVAQIHALDPIHFGVNPGLDLDTTAARLIALLEPGAR